MNATVPYASLLQAVHEENEVLRETIRQLHAALVPVMAFPASWKLSRQSGIILSCLMAASPGIATRERLILAVWGYDDAKLKDAYIALTGRVVFLRKSLSLHAPSIRIWHEAGLGYRIERADRDALKVLLAPEIPNRLTRSTSLPGHPIRWSPQAIESEVRHG